MACLGVGRLADEMVVWKHFQYLRRSRQLSLCIFEPCAREVKLSVCAYLRTSRGTKDSSTA